MSKKNEYKSKKIKDFMDKHNLLPWDEIEFKIKDKKHIGVILPRYELTKGDFLSIKLDTGYNLGLDIDKMLDIEKIGHKEGKYKLPNLEKSQDSDLPEVTIIGCGGTIASRLDYRTGAVIPAFTPEELLSMNEELLNLAQIKTFMLFEKFSEDMVIDDWLKVARSVKIEYDKNKPKGIVLAHGTDTMAYGAAILAFAMRNIPIPIILTGSQRSADRPSSDAFLNIMNATYVAAYSKYKGVAILMHSESGDTKAWLHNPLKVRKSHTSRRNAFQSINIEPMAVVDYKEKLFKMQQNNFFSTSEEFEIVTNFEEKVAIVWVHPNIQTSLLSSAIENNSGIILLGTGLGHVPSSLYSIIRKGRKIDKEFLMISQCLSGFVSMNVYDSGRELLELGVIPGLNMTPEAAYAKFSYGLANTKGHEELVKFMLKEYSTEFSNKRENNNNF